MIIVAFQTCDLVLHVVDFAINLSRQVVDVVGLRSQLGQPSGYLRALAVDPLDFRTNVGKLRLQTMTLQVLGLALAFCLLV